MSRRGENIYKRKDGRWEGRYKIGVDERGRTRYRSVYCKTYREIKEKMAKVRSPETVISSGRLTVEELCGEWLDAIACRVKRSTLANYKMKLKKHIIPVFGGLRYSDMTAQRLQWFIRSKLNSGLSPKYVADIVILFKSVAKYASQTRGFANPVEYVRLPLINKREPSVYSEKQQTRLCRQAFKEKSGTCLCVLMSLYMGLRVGEVCALRWSDIDLEKSVVTVKKTVQRIYSASSGKTELLIDTPKSRSSYRQIPIPVFLQHVLKRYDGKSGYVLSGSERLIEPRTMQNRFKALLKRAGLPMINYHALRHMFATNCVAAGFDVKTLSEILGHSSVETTLNRYVHSSLNRKREFMLRLEAAI